MSNPVCMIQNSSSTMEELLDSYERKKTLIIKKNPRLYKGEKLSIELPEKYHTEDAYNPCRPFYIDGEWYMLIRIEPRDDCRQSKVCLFKKDPDGVWRIVPNVPPWHMEDGFCLPYKDGFIVKGVKAYLDPTPDNPKNVGYHMVFYHVNKDFTRREEFAQGPPQMKGTRFIIPEKGPIPVFTRRQELQPDGSYAGLGELVYLELSSLDELNPETLLKKGKAIKNQFPPGTWGGVNEIFLLSDGRLGVLGHIAYRDEEGIRHYCVMTFIYDTDTYEATPIEIIATRSDFPPGESKAPDLIGVAYPGGMVWLDDGTVEVYVGLGDAEIGCIIEPNPFLNKEIDINSVYKMAVSS